MVVAPVPETLNKSVPAALRSSRSNAAFLVRVVVPKMTSEPKVAVSEACTNRGGVESLLWLMAMPSVAIVAPPVTTKSPATFIPPDDTSTAPAAVTLPVPSTVNTVVESATASKRLKLASALRALVTRRTEFVKVPELAVMSTAGSVPSEFVITAPPASTCREPDRMVTSPDETNKPPPSMVMPLLEVKVWVVSPLANVAPCPVICTTQASARV